MDRHQFSLRERVERALARALTSLPERAQLKLSLQRPVSIDGDLLHPEMQLILAIQRLQTALGGDFKIDKHPPHIARELVKRITVVHSGPFTPVAAVTDLEIDAGSVKLRARHYRPPGVGSAPLLVFFHGGGFLWGDVETHDAPCRFLCRHADVQVLSVEYRLAPENPFPAAVDDALAAFAWAQANAEALGADPARVGVGGDSAGGNLAAVVALMAATEGRPRPALQLLIYPATDRTWPYRSLSLFREGFLFTTADLDYYTAQYTQGADLHDVRISPLKARNLSGLPRAIVVTAGFDPIRDEGEAYADALSAAGTPCELLRMKGLTHGFINLLRLSAQSREAMTRMAQAVRAGFARPSG